MPASQLSSDDLVRRARDWVFLTGSRRLLAGAFVLGVAALTAGLIGAGALNVGQNSAAYTVFGSGFVAGLLTLVTVALSVNQLALSRIFGSPGDLKGDVESAIQFRSNVGGIAGDPSTPTDPGAFLRLLGETLQEEVGEFERCMSGANPDLAAEFADYTADLVEFGGRLSEISPEADSTNVLHQMLTTEYASYLANTRALRNRHQRDLPESADGSLDAIMDLLESIAAARQFYKTLAVQQELAKLSHRLIFAGSIALLTCVYVALAYSTGSPLTIPPGLRIWVVSAALGIAISPLVLLMSHILRIATISLYTVSTGPFHPPQKRYEEGEE